MQQRLAFESRTSRTSARAPRRPATVAPVVLRQQHRAGGSQAAVVCKAAAVEVQDYLADVTLQSWEMDVLELDQRSFHDFLKATADRVVVVDFFTNWCGPCKAMAPFIEQLATKMDPRKVLFVKVDCQTNRELVKELNIKSLPTFQLYRGAEKVSEVTGSRKDRLVQLINTALGNSTSSTDQS